MAKKLILIRHGMLEPEYSGRFVGRIDAGLSSAGRRQAEALARCLDRLEPGSIIASPLRRARETADIAMKTRDQSCLFDDGLCEIDFGDWEKKTFDEIKAADPENAARWGRFEKDFAFPGGESLSGFIDRIGALARRLASHPAPTVAAMTHGGVIRFLICHFLGLDPRHYLLFNVDYASVSILDLFGGAGVLTRLNDVCHLEAKNG